MTTKKKVARSRKEEQSNRISEEWVNNLKKNLDLYSPKKATADRGAAKHERSMKSSSPMADRPGQRYLGKKEEKIKLIEREI